MAIPKITSDLSVISKLGDNPNTDNGLTAEQLKAVFDQAPNMIKSYINEKLVPAIGVVETAAASAKTAADEAKSAAGLKREFTAIYDGSGTTGFINGDQTAFRTPGSASKFYNIAIEKNNFADIVTMDWAIINEVSRVLGTGSFTVNRALASSAGTVAVSTIRATVNSDNTVTFTTTDGTKILAVVGYY